jgi:hypothetical protein
LMFCLFPFLFFLLVPDYFPYFSYLIFIFRSLFPLFPFLLLHISSAELPVPISWTFSSTVRYLLTS